MRHKIDGRKFGRNTSHRVAMLRAMANNLILSEKVVTTKAKAKELRRVVDRLVTLGKKGSGSARRLAFARTRNPESVTKLFDVFASRYTKRPGGYTRVLGIDTTRWGDGAEMALVEMVDRPIEAPKKKTKKSSSENSDSSEKLSASSDKAPKKARSSNPGSSKAKNTGTSLKGAARTAPSKVGSGS